MGIGTQQPRNANATKPKPLKKKQKDRKLIKYIFVFVCIYVISYMPLLFLIKDYIITYINYN